MSAVFIKIFNMCITASYMMLAVILFRMLLKKAPKWLTCILWALVALRLVFPFSFESMISLIPNDEPVPRDITLSKTPAVNTGVPAINNTVNPVILNNFTPAVGDSVNPLQVYIKLAAIVWLMGIFAMIVYALISYLRLKRTVAASIPVNDGVRACDDIKTPFILGIVKPVIYIPSGVDGETLDYVLKHEHAHLKRHDHFWKPLGFLLLTVYWFNPLCWISYILLCRDIEAACDEKVIKDMDKEAVAGYSEALLDLSFKRAKIAACPLAFGETGVKGRVRSILNYKKPAFWIIIAGLIACVLLLIFFLKRPQDDASSVVNLGEPVKVDSDVPTLFMADMLSSQFHAGFEPTILGYSWSQRVKGDDWTGIVVDAIAPFSPEAEKFIDHVRIIEGDDAHPYPYMLSFSIEPYKVIMTEYDLEEVKNGKAEYKEGTDITDEVMFKTLKKGRLYVIRAYFEGEDHKGDANYCFVTEPEDKADQNASADDVIVTPQVEPLPVMPEYHTLYETKADITHDGIDDRIALEMAYFDESETEDPDRTLKVTWANVAVYSGKSGDCIFRSGDISMVHAGNGVLYLTEYEGEKYLLEASVEAYQGEDFYNYCLYSLDESGEQLTLMTGHDSWEMFDIDEDGYYHEKDRSETDPHFEKYEEAVRPLLSDDAIVLIACDVDAERPVYSKEGKVESALDYFDSHKYY